MLKALEERRTGDVPPRVFQSDMIMHRTLRLGVSQDVFVRSVHSNGCTAMDLDGIEERFLLSGGKDGRIAIHDLQNSSGNLPFTAGLLANIRPTAASHHRSMARVQWYPFDTGLFTTSSKCKKLRLWDANRLVAVETFETECHINFHDMSTVASSQSLIAVAKCDSNIILYDARSGNATHHLRGHSSYVECLKWSPTTANELTSGGRDNRILVWDVRSARNFVKSYDEQNGENPTKGAPNAHNNKISCLKFTSDGRYLVSRDLENHLQLWDVTTGKHTFVNFGPVFKRDDVRRTLFLPNSLDICDDSSLPVLFMANNNVINVYDLFTGYKYLSLRSHFNSVFCCVFRPMVQELYTGANDKNIFAWSPCTTWAKADDDSDNWSD